MLDIDESRAGKKHS
jgi:hypothetical protein